MDFPKFLYLVGKAPRLFYLVKELWHILTDNESDELERFFDETQDFVERSKKAKTKEERRDVLIRISQSIAKL